jgi:3-hydroxybutyrate dehydrogenase
MLKGKVAVVTGSTSGIGLGIAKRLAAEGVNIMLNGFGDAEEIETIRADLESTHGIKAAYNGADLTKADEAKGLIKAAVSELGSVDILVNNAGMQHVDAIEDFPDEKWEKLIALNLSAGFYTTKEAMGTMRKNGYGRIINIASAHGLVASAKKAAYVSSKHGLVGLTKVVALETAEEDITCNAICPGWVLTPLVQKQIDDWAKRDGISAKEAEVKLLSEKQPSLQFTTPEQLGGLVIFLCGEDGKNITGTSLSVDGAWTAK